MVNTEELRDLVVQGAEQLGVPGVALGLLLDGEETYVTHGVTSVENPLPVEEHTLFHIGSTTKTFTATALMRLVERGDVDLDATVRTYLPDFSVKDEDVSARATVLHTLNHTAGWDGDFFLDTGFGDDALERYVAAMSGLGQTSELGGQASYNNASFSVAGHIVAVVTGKTYEQATKDLVLDPLGLDESLFFLRDVITRRFAVGHVPGEDGGVGVARPYDMQRGNGPAGDIVSTAPDQIRYARFHLGDGRAADGTRVLSGATMRQMQTETSTFTSGESVGLSWMIQDVDGVRFVAHGGSTIGQQSLFELAPERGYALTILTNAHNGAQLNGEVAKWVRETYLGVVERDPEPIEIDAAALAEFAGIYARPEVMTTITVDGPRLLMTFDYTDEGRETVLRELGTLVPLPDPTHLAIVGPDEYFAVDGMAKGLRGKFLRSDDGRVTSVDLGGRIANRTP
jgi:CubicO group peptidase (beta-lactamase class C family)